MSASKTNNPMYGKKHSNYTKLLMVAAKSKPVYVYSTNNQLLASYPNSVKVAEWLKITKTTVNKYIKNGKVWNNKYIFRKIPL